MNSLIHGISESGRSLLPPTNPEHSIGKTQSDFANILKESIENVNDLQQASNLKTEKLASGQTEGLHEVMIAAQKASISIEAAVQIQRKAIDAYNEIMRMQI